MKDFSDQAYKEILQWHGTLYISLCLQHLNFSWEKCLTSIKESLELQRPDFFCFWIVSDGGLFPSSHVSVNSSLHLLKALLLAWFAVLQGLVSAWSLLQITSLTCLCCLCQVLLYTKRTGKKPQTKQKSPGISCWFPFLCQDYASSSE